MSYVHIMIMKLYDVNMLLVRCVSTARICWPSLPSEIWRLPSSERSSVRSMTFSLKSSISLASSHSSSLSLLTCNRQTNRLKCFHISPSLYTLSWNQSTPLTLWITHQQCDNISKQHLALQNWGLNYLWFWAILTVLDRVNCQTLSTDNTKRFSRILASPLIARQAWLQMTGHLLA